MPALAATLLIRLFVRCYPVSTSSLALAHSTIRAYALMRGTMYAMLQVNAQTPDECPERDFDGHCNCKKVTHTRILPPRNPTYPDKSK